MQQAGIQDFEAVMFGPASGMNALKAGNVGLSSVVTIFSKAAVRVSGTWATVPAGREDSRR